MRVAPPPITAGAGRAPLPADFFVGEFRRAEAGIDLTQRSERLFEMRQHLGGRTIPQDASLILGVISVCVAAGLSNSRGFSGWAMTTKPVPPDRALESIYMTIILLNHERELAAIPSPTGWTPYLDNSRPAPAPASR